MTDTTELRTEDVLAELDDWLGSNWDPDLSVGDWWQRLGEAGWSAPSLPPTAFGRGLSRSDAVAVAERIAQRGALGAPAGLGLLLAAPTIAAHGTPAQIATYVADIVTGRRGWCQLFSEPSAGSDLAGLQSRAVRDGDEWVVTGQKVWTSTAQYADFGMLLARTDPDAPKHRGLTYFALPMLQDGVDVRPLKEMTGHALFNEVFLTEARAPADAAIGEVNQGWLVANTTLMNERAGLGSGGGSSAGGAATPGTVAGDLTRRAGDFVSTRRSGGAGLGGAPVLIELAKRTGQTDDPLIRQDLARLYTIGEIGRMNALRLKAAKEAGGDIPGLPNVAKLSMSAIVALSRDLGLRLLGAAGTLHAYEGQDRSALDRLDQARQNAAVTEMALISPAPSIYGGTDQIQRNIIGERVLGLPREPGPDRDTPFSALPKNV